MSLKPHLISSRGPPGVTPYLRRIVEVTTTIFGASSRIGSAFKLGGACNGTSVLALGPAKLAVGVRGIMVRSNTGVAGAGKLPSLEGLQPVLSVSAIMDLVCSSVTQAAEL